MVYIGTHFVHILKTVSHVFHKLVAAPAEGNRIVVEVDVRSLTFLVPTVNTNTTVAVRDDHVVIYLNLTATGIELQAEIGTVGNKAVTDNHVTGNSTIRVENLVLDLWRNSVFHTTGLKRSRWAAVTLIVRVVRFIEVLQTHVEHDTIDDECAANGVRSTHSVQVARCGNQTFASISSTLLFTRLNTCDIFERIALCEVCIPTTFQGDEVVDLDVTLVRVTEEITFADANDSAVVAVLFNDVQYSLNVLLCSSRS